MLGIHWAGLDLSPSGKSRETHLQGGQLLERLLPPPRAGARGTPRPQSLAHQPRVCGAASGESCKGSAMTPPGEPWASHGPSGRRPLRPPPPASVWSPAGL